MLLARGWGPDDSLLAQVHALEGYEPHKHHPSPPPVAAALLRKYVGGDEEGGEEKADLQKVFGFIGLFTLVGLWWLGKQSPRRERGKGRGGMDVSRDQCGQCGAALLPAVLVCYSHSQHACRPPDNLSAPLPTRRLP